MFLVVFTRVKYEPSGIVSEVPAPAVSDFPNSPEALNPQTP